jgi:HlyD family secretion protein
MTATAPALQPAFPSEGLPGSGAVPDIDRCLEELAELAQTELSIPAFYAALLDRVLRVLPAVGGAAWACASGRAELLCQSRFPQPLVDRQRPALLENGQPPIHACCLPAHARAADNYPCDHPYPWPLVVCPLAADDRNLVVIEFALGRESGPDVQASAAHLVGVLAEIAGDFHRRRELTRLRQRESALTQFADLVSRLHARLDPVATAYSIANDGRQWIGCDRVSVLRLRHGRGLALAVSAVDQMDRSSRQVAALESLAAAVAASGEPLAWHEASGEELPPQLASALQSYLDIGHARQLAVMPLRPVSTANQPTDSLPLGVLVAERFGDERPWLQMRERAAELARAAGPALANALEHHALPLLPLQQRVAKISHALSQRPVAAALCGLALAAAIVLSAIVPADFSVQVEGTVQPEIRRSLFAPADGVATEVRAQHGERVAAGEVLLRIRNPNLDLELARASGELQTAQAKLNAVRSARSRPQEALGSGEQDRLASEEEQLNEQVQGLREQLRVLGDLRGELNVTSPLDGIVLTWNTQQLLADRPVKQGHLLLAVADPAGPWNLELQVPDAELGHVLAGQQADGAQLPVTFLLTSDPALTRRGHLQSLALATDVASGRSTAAAIATLDDPLPEGVRADSQVTARIHCGRRSIAYVWLHDLIDFIRTSMLF